MLEACKEAGLENLKVVRIRDKTDARTIAEESANCFRHRSNSQFFVCSSDMYCDIIDMCFFYRETGIPYMTFSGFAARKEGYNLEIKRLAEAFEKGQKALDIMKQLFDDEKEEEKNENGNYK